MKTRNYYLTRAIIHTLLTALVYLCIPKLAIIYYDWMKGEYIGYTIFAGCILVLMTIILLFISWIPALDKDERNKRNQEQ